MKKMQIFLLMALCFLIIGCGNNNPSNISNTKNNDIIVTVDNERFKLNSKNNLNKMHYVENYVDFRSDRIGNMYIMYYYKNSDFIFDIRLTYEEDHSFEENKSKMGNNSSTKIVNNIEYTYFDIINDQNNHVHVYMYYYQNATYVVAFTFAKDITDLENTFMNNIYFE